MIKCRKCGRTPDKIDGPCIGTINEACQWVMSESQEIHLANIKYYFQEKVDAKYRTGAIEHGGDLQDMDMLRLIDNAIDECVDQFTYLTTLREKYAKHNIR